MRFGPREAIGKSQWGGGRVEEGPNLTETNGILIYRGHDPFGQHQESRNLACPNFLTCAENSFCNFQPIGFVRFGKESVNHGLPVLGVARGLHSWC